MDKILSAQTDTLESTVPDLVPYLHPSERVLHVEFPDIQTPLAAPDALTALLRLTKAPSVSEIGEHGPPIAATATEGNAHVEELRLFETLFGRDSLIVSTFLLEQFPRLAHATIIALLELQGTRTVMASEEESGRILHEYRSKDDPVGRMIRERDGWEFPYYGSVDATPLLVNLVVAFCVQEGPALLSQVYTNKDGEQCTVLDGLDAAMNWIMTRMDTNPEGFLEFCRVNPKGISNQVWKDSPDSYFHADGTLADHSRGIASVEVQGYVYDALIGAAELCDVVAAIPLFSGRYKSGYSADLLSRAARLRGNVMTILWKEDAYGGYFALGTDRDEAGRVRVLGVRASNMGHLLATRMLSQDDRETVRKREALVATLLHSDFLNASGIRTLSKKEVRFSPGAYHNGTVWLWDTYMISCGLRKYGYSREAEDLDKRMWSVIEKFKKFPEFARGGEATEPQLNTRIIDIWCARDERVNRIEQPPQEIQAWTVAAAIASGYRHGQ